MEPGSRRETLTDNGLLHIEDCLDATGNIVLPPGATLASLIDRNAGDSVAYRYLEHSRSVDGEAAEVM
jgi:fatty-acyl-CoA synthase